MLYIPHVVLRHKLDGDARQWLRWIIPLIEGPYGNLGHMLNVNILLCKIAAGRRLKAGGFFSFGFKTVVFFILDRLFSHIQSY